MVILYTFMKWKVFGFHIPIEPAQSSRNPNVLSKQPLLKFSSGTFPISRILAIISIIDVYKGIYAVYLGI